MEHPVAEQTARGPRLVVVQNECRSPARKADLIGRWTSCRSWWRLQAEQHCFNALGDGVIDGNHFDAGGATPGVNGDLARQRDVIDPIRGRAANRVKYRQGRIGFPAPAYHKGGRVAARAMIRPPVPQIARPTARASRNGPPPVAPAEWAFDGNRIGRDNRHDWAVR